MVIETNDVKAAMETIIKWARENNIDYVTTTYIENNNYTNCRDGANITYTVRGSKKYNDNGSLKLDYYKDIYIPIEQEESAK